MRDTDRKHTDEEIVDAVMAHGLTVFSDRDSDIYASGKAALARLVEAAECDCVPAFLSSKSCRKCGRRAVISQEKFREIVEAAERTEEVERQGSWAIERVREAASLFGVCDGGRYWNDWKESHSVLYSRIAAAEAERDTALDERDEARRLEGSQMLAQIGLRVAAEAERDAALARVAELETALRPVVSYIEEHYFVNEIHDGDEQLVVMMWPAEIHAARAALGA